MNKILLIGLIVCTLIVMSCEETEGKINPFVGTWESDCGSVWWIFTDNEVSHSTHNVGEDPVVTGTYTYDDTHVIINTTYRHPVYSNLDIYPEPFLFEYLFDGDTLRVGVFGAPIMKRK